MAEQRDCDVCLGRGYIFPTSSNGDVNHAWVERCDTCEIFCCDADAALKVQKDRGGVILAAQPLGVSSLHPYLEDFYG